MISVFCWKKLIIRYFLKSVLLLKARFPLNFKKLYVGTTLEKEKIIHCVVL